MVTGRGELSTNIKTWIFAKETTQGTWDSS